MTDPINLTSEYELRVVASDHEALRLLLRTFGFTAAARVKIANALAEDRGVSVHELLQLFVNAGARTITAGISTRFLPCNITPECNADLGHNGDCDTEIGF